MVTIVGCGRVKATFARVGESRVACSGGLEVVFVPPAGVEGFLGDV
jgi:hypothetical protein